MEVRLTRAKGGGVIKYVSETKLVNISLYLQVYQVQEWSQKKNIIVDSPNCYYKKVYEDQ